MSISGRRLPRTVSNGCRTRAFFSLGKTVQAPGKGAPPTFGRREEFTREEVEDYFNCAGILAAEGNYDRMEALIATGQHPLDILLILACEENDASKVQELLAIGANPNVKDLNGRTPAHICIEQEIKDMLG